MKKEDLPENVLKAFQKYEKAQDAASNDVMSETAHVKADKKAMRYYNAFVKECEKEGLTHIEVNKLFIPTSIKLSK